MRSDLSYETLVNLVMQFFGCDELKADGIITQAIADGRYNDLVIYVRFNR